MNIVFINADTYRRDHIGAYGNRWINTPNFDRFAAESVVFDRAYAGSFPTVPNRLDVLTGRYVFTTYDWSRLPDDALCFPKLLNEAGYVTMMVCDTPHILAHGYNFQRDFTAFEWIRGQEHDEWRTAPIEVKLPCDARKLRRAGTSAVQYLRNVADRETEADYFAPRTMQAACDWLERNHRQEKFFLYVDTFDPHEPWDPPAYYTEMYDPGYDGQEVIYPRYDFCDFLTKKELKHIRALYAGECTMVDRWVGKLLAKIDDLGLRDNTLVFFTTDHGFLHGEHGITGKSIIRKNAFGPCPLFEEIARIPLMVRHPKVRGGRRLRAFVQPPDIAPTILDAARVGRPPSMHGHSLIPLLKGKKRSLRPFAVTSLSIIRSRQAYIPSTITTDRWSFIYSNPVERRRRATTRVVDSIERKHLNRLFPRIALYDLKSDPGQSRNVAGKHPDVVRRLHRRYVRFLETLDTPEEYLASRREL